jgi:hypothetical protein
MTILESACWLAIAAIAIWSARLGGDALSRVELLRREQLRRDVEGWEDHA